MILLKMTSVFCDISLWLGAKEEKDKLLVVPVIRKPLVDSKQ